MDTSVNYDQETNWINTFFIPQYQQNPDVAYKIIIEHAASFISGTNRHRMILKTDSTPLDFVYIAQQLPEILHTLKGLQRPQPTQFPQLPIPINDLKPTVEDQRKQAERFYTKLKLSICGDTSFSEETDIPDGDILTLGNYLKKFHVELASNLSTENLLLLSYW